MGFFPYLNTGYCTQTTFFDTAEFVSYSLHMIAFIAIPMHLFGAYCILFKTPKSMTSVKLHLLNLHFWSCFLDLSLSLLTTPYLLFPSFSGYPLGLFKEMGLGTSEQVLFIMITLGVFLVSMIQVFEIRFLIFIDENCIWRRIRIPWFLFNYLLAIVYIIPIYFLIPEQEKAKNFVFHSFFVCIPSYIQYDRVFVFVTETAVSIRMIAAVLIFLMVQVVIFAVMTGKTLKLKTGRNVSRNTLNLQIKFQRALKLQILIPATLLLPPLGYLAFSNQFTVHYQYLNNISLIVASSHGFFSTIVLIAVQAPYRAYFLRLVGFEAKLRNDTEPHAKISVF